MSPFITTTLYLALLTFDQYLCHGAKTSTSWNDISLSESRHEILRYCGYRLERVTEPQMHRE